MTDLPIDALPLPGVTNWRVGVEVVGAAPRQPWSERVHRGLGPELHARACALNCGDAPCRLGPGCAFARTYGPNVERRFRLDTSDLDGRRGPPALRLVCLASPDEGLLLASLPAALAPHRPRTLDPLCHGGDDPPLGPLDLGARAAELVGDVGVELRSLCALKRDEAPVTHPTLLDLLHAARLRVRRLGLDTSAFPPFEEEVTLLDEATPCPGVRLHRNRDGAAPIPGVHHALRVHATPAQAAWIALAEVVGVGGKTALGFGVVRATSLAPASAS